MNKQPRLLYIEDDELERRAFLRVVREKGLAWEVKQAATLAAARAQLAVSQFDIIVADYHLPDGDSAELFGEIPEIPFVLVTGTVQELLAVRTLERGADDYLVKDMEHRHLEALPLAVEKTLYRQAIHERERRLTQELRASEQRLRATFDNSASGIIETDGRDRFVAVNDRLCQMLGYRREELVGMSVHDLTYPEDRPQSDELNGQHREGRLPTFQYEKRYLKRDGSPLWVHVAVTAVHDDTGRYLYSVATVLDISERKRAEAGRLALQRQMEQAQRLESLGVLAGGIAHDFNNLLSVVLGYADLAIRQASPASPARESLAEIEKAGRRAAELCCQMLAYAGKGKFVVGPVDLCGLVEGMAQLLKTTVSKKATLTLDVEKPIPPTRGDAMQMRQIVMNLITNASEALGEGSGTIRISTGMMECSQEYLSKTYLDDKLPAGAYVYLEVSDTGCGMSRETIARMFEPFFTTKFTGRGLGLAAVLGMVRGHEGAIHVASELGRGTTIRVLFPALKEASASATVAGQSAEAPLRLGGRALLVEDEAAVRLLGARMLGLLGYEALTAADGQQAVELYAARWHEIDLVILDLTMPRMDGEEALRELRRINPEVRVILCSGYSAEEIADRFAGKGLAGFLPKPFGLAALKHALEQLARAEQR